LVQPTQSPESSQTAQSASPGAETSIVRPYWPTPAEDSAEMFELRQVPLPKAAASA
jgi:hypothetical protein